MAIVLCRDYSEIVVVACSDTQCCVVIITVDVLLIAIAYRDKESLRTNRKVVFR